MEAAIKNSSADPEKIFRLMPNPGLIRRLASAASSTLGELSGGTGSYLRAAFLPDRFQQWFPIKLARLLRESLAHPGDAINGVFAGDPIDLKRRRRLIPVLSVSAGLHGVLILYLIYLAFFSPYAHVRVVNKAYRQFDPNVILAPLYYPAQIRRQAAAAQTMTLEEIRERARKRREDREKAEAERLARQEAERKAAEEAAAKEAAAKAAAEKPATPAKFGEINERAIKDTVKKLYEIYQAGSADAPDATFSVMAGFKVEPDGSLSNIRIIQKSKSKSIDTKALEILWTIGESHALAPVSDLSSATISLDVTEDMAKIRITAFAPTADVAKAKSDLLNVLFWGLGMKQKNRDVSLLISLLKAKSDGKRVDTILNVPRERAAQMMRAEFEKPTTPPQ